MTEREIVVIGGRESRHGPQTVVDVTRLLRERGAHVAQSIVVKDRRALAKRIRKLAKSGPKLFVVCGGDGAQTTACGVLAKTRSALAVIPGGTGNSFARTLGLDPADLPAAVDVALRGHCKRIDLGCVNGRYFANFATIGLTAEVGAHTPHWLKQIAGSFAYALGAVGPMLRERPFRAKIRTKAKVLKLKTYQIVIASGRFFGTKPLAPDADPDDGKLTLFTTTGLSRAALVRMYFAVAGGKQTGLPDAVFLNAKKIRIETKRKLLVSIDGDAGGHTPATFSVARNALHVMVPRPPLTAPSLLAINI